VTGADVTAALADVQRAQRELDAAVKRLARALDSTEVMTPVKVPGPVKVTELDKARARKRLRELGVRV
jgi:hypothetical protein